MFENLQESVQEYQRLQLRGKSYPKAHKVRKEFRKIQNQWNTELLSGFSDKEKEALFASLRKLAVNAEASFNQQHTQASNCRAA